MSEINLNYASLLVEGFRSLIFCRNLHNAFKLNAKITCGCWTITAKLKYQVSSVKNVHVGIYVNLNSLYFPNFYENDLFYMTLHIIVENN